MIYLLIFMLAKLISLLRSGAGGARKTLAHAQKQVPGSDRALCLTVAAVPLSDGRSLLSVF